MLMIGSITPAMFSEEMVTRIEARFTDSLTFCLRI